MTDFCPHPLLMREAGCQPENGVGIFSPTPDFPGGKIESILTRNWRLNQSSMVNDWSNQVYVMKTPLKQKDRDSESF